MSRLRNRMMPLFHVSLIAKIYNRLITAFSANPDTIIAKIHIIHIQPHTLRYTNTRAQKQRKKCYITCLGNIMKSLLCFGKSCTVLHLVQKNRHFIGIQTHDFFIMQFRKGYKLGGIFFNQFFFKVVIIKTAQRRQFSLFAALIIGINLTVFLIIRKIVRILLNVFPAEPVQQRERVVPDFHFGTIAVLFV